MRAFILGTALAAALLGGQAQAQAGRAEAEAFVRRVYASYADDERVRPMMDAGLEQVFSRRLAGLIRRDRELSGDDLPYLDADPICECQDWEGLRVQSVRVDRGPGETLDATVDFLNGGQLTIVKLRLRREAAGWRIDDVVNSHGYPGLAETLAESNRRIEAGGRALHRDQADRACQAGGAAG